MVRRSSGGGAPGDLFAPAKRDRAPWAGVAPPDDPDGALPAGEGAERAGASGAPQADESRLIGRLVARDEAAFNTLVRTYEQRVFALIVRMIGSRAEAEDLAQEVFVQVFKAIGSFRGESKLSTWIYRIAINLTKNRNKYLRVRRTAQQEELEGVEERGPIARSRHSSGVSIERPDELAAGRQLETMVQEAILAIEPSFRECLVLRDIEDLSYEEIGAITGLPEGTVKSRIHRARAQLKELVERALGEKIP
jgi:RNA polymerase sigma-70 factor (ECF subfamily)